MSSKAEENQPTVVKSDDEWKRELTAEQYHVTREKGTERAFTGPYWNNKEKGLYKCVCCGAPLFDSSTKFDSGTGWPSFWKPVDEQKVGDRVRYQPLDEPHRGPLPSLPRPPRARVRRRPGAYGAEVLHQRCGARVRSRRSRQGRAGRGSWRRSLIDAAGLESRRRA